MGYVKSGSIPSITAGLTVGSLVYISYISHPCITKQSSTNNGKVPTRRLSNSGQEDLRSRACSSCLHHPGWIIHSEGTEKPETTPGCVESDGIVWIVHLWECVEDPKVGHNFGWLYDLNGACGGNRGCVRWPKSNDLAPFQI